MKKLTLLLILAVLTVNSSCSKKNNSTPQEKVVQSQNLWDLSSIEVDDLDFGIVDENVSSVLTINIINKTESLVEGIPSLVSEHFNIVYSNCKDLAVDDKCIIKVVFNSNSSTQDNYSGNLHFGPHTNIVFASINKRNFESVSFFSNSTPVTNFSFGTLNYYNSVIKTFVLKNMGEVPVEGTLSLQSTDFKVVYDQCSGRVLEPTKKCIFKLMFSGIGKTGPVTDVLSYGDYNLVLSSTVLNFSQLSQLYSDIKLFYQTTEIESVLDLGTLNLNSSPRFNFIFKNTGAESGQVSSSINNLLETQNYCKNSILRSEQFCIIRTLIPTPIKGVFGGSITADINGDEKQFNLQWLVRAPGDKISCTNQIPFAQLANITWTGNNYTNCIVESCVDNYALVSNECLYIFPIAQSSQETLNEDTTLNNASFIYTSITGFATGEIVTQPAHGSVLIVGDKFSYTPNPNFNGVDTFSFKINDGNESSEISTVSLTINPINDHPITQDLTVSGVEDTVLIHQLEASDIDGDSLSYSIVSQPSHGAVVVSTSGLMSYTPNLNFNGSDSFTIKVNDGLVDSNVATVNINLSAINDSPVLAGISSINTNINTSTSGGNNSFTITDIDSSTFTYSITQGTKGVLSINASSGSFSYVPNSNSYGSDTIQVSVSDGINYSNILNISVNIVGSGIILTGDGSRTYFDGTMANNCYSYKNSVSGNKNYSGSTGSGVYKIKSGSETVNVYCDQDTDGGGWTLAIKTGDYANINSFNTLSTSAVNVAGLTNTTVIGIGAGYYSKLSDTMINNIRSSTAGNFAAYRLEKVNGNFNGTYRKLFYPGSCSWAVRGANIASVAPECTKRASVYNATSFTTGGSVSWCNQPNMSRHYLCSDVHEAFTIVSGYESSENHNIPQHRVWIR